MIDQTTISARTNQEFISQDRSHPSHLIFHDLLPEWQRTIYNAPKDALAQAVHINIKAFSVAATKVLLRILGSTPAIGKFHVDRSSLTV